MSAVGENDVGERREWETEGSAEDRKDSGRGGGTFGYNDVYYPAGSISSHRDSLSVASDEDASQPAPHADLCGPLLSDDNPSFQPTSDNIILFEVCSPAPKSSDSLRLDSLDLFKQPRLPLFEDTETSPLYTADEDKPQKIKLFDVNENTMGDSWRWGQIATEAEIPPTHASSQFLSTIVQMQRVISQQKWEIDTLKEARVTTDKAEKGTMTTNGDIVPTLRREIEHLSSACKRYERQNQELRTEIQACTSDLMQLDKAKTKLARELKKAVSKAEAFEGEFLKISEFVEKVLNRDEDDEHSPSQPEKDPKHLSNYVSSQVEIIGSRYSRLLAAYDRITEENQRLKENLEKREIIPQAVQIDANSREKLKEKLIKKLEKTLSSYKEKLMEMKEDGGSEGESLTPVLNKTENLTNRLRGMCEDLKPFRSQHSSPEPPLAPSPDPTTGFSFIDHSPSVPKPDPRASFPSSSDSQNDTSEGVMLKPETPVQVKRSAWKQKQSQRNAQLAIEKYRPVLLARDAKEPSFRIGKGEEEGGRRVLTANRQYLGKSHRADSVNTKKTSTDLAGKSISVERKRQRVPPAPKK